MSIKDFIGKIKSILADFKEHIKIREDLFIILIVFLVGTASFGLGKLSSYEKQKTPISILKTQDSVYATVAESLLDKEVPKTTETIQNTASETQKGIVLASKSGTKYYYPWCSGVARIKEENKVWFNTIEEARAKGLTPAANCPGLK